MKITKEWFEKAAAREGDHEIGAGRLPTYIPGFVPSEADRYYNAVIAGLHSRIAELESALSVPAAAIVGEPDGWKLVPIEPTPEMLVYIAKACRDFLSEDGPYPRAKAVYRATISSAPKPNGANNDA